MTRISLHATGTLIVLLGLLGIACGGGSSSNAGPTNAASAEEPNPDPHRSVDTPGGHVTFGFRAAPGVDEEHVQIVGVLVGMDGEEQVLDLGEWEGELTVAPAGDGELGHVHLEGPEPHEFVAVPVGDTDLDLLIDGRRVQRIHFEAAMAIEANQPLLLTPPTMDVRGRGAAD